MAGALLTQQPARWNLRIWVSGLGAWFPGGRARGWSRVGWLAGDVCAAQSGGWRVSPGESNASSSCSGWMTAAAGPCGGWHLPVWARARVQAVIFWRSLTVT